LTQYAQTIRTPTANFEEFFGHSSLLFLRQAAKKEAQAAAPGASARLPSLRVKTGGGGGGGGIHVLEPKL